MFDNATNLKRKFGMKSKTEYSFAQVFTYDPLIVPLIKNAKAVHFSVEDQETIIIQDGEWLSELKIGETYHIVAVGWPDISLKWECLSSGSSPVFNLICDQQNATAIASC